MTNSSLICWPRGNDVSLTIYLYEPQVDANGIPVRDQQGNIVWEPVDVDAYDEWRVRVKTDEYIPLPSAAGATAGTLVVKVPGTFPCGVYAVEFTGMKNGFAVRSFETTMFGIVESNGDANVTFDVVDGERSCDIDIKIQIVPFSVERGKNAYELWKEQPGNEDKTMQDYIDEVLDLNGITDACITATEAANAAAVIGSHPDYIGEDYYVYHWQNGQYVKTDIYVKGPKGDKGSKGATGSAATISVGTVTTGQPGTNASVTNVGTSSAAIFNFTIPRGDKGEQGDPGSGGSVAWDDITGKPMKYAAFSAIDVATAGEITDTTTLAAIASLKNSGIMLGDLVLLNYDNWNTTSAIVATVSNVNPLRMTFFCRQKMVILTEAPANTYTSRIIDLDSIPPAPVQSNWNETDNTSLAYIQNKPTIPAAQVQSDWDESNSNLLSFIKHKPNVYNVQYSQIDSIGDSDGLYVIRNGGVYGGIIYTSSIYQGIATQVMIDAENGYIRTRKMTGGTWGAWSSSVYYIKPSGGIPSTDLASAVQTSLGLADTALQSQTNADWNAVSGAAQILNKPTIPAAQVNSDWNASSGVAQILNKPTIPDVSGLASKVMVVDASTQPSTYNPNTVYELGTLTGTVTINPFTATASGDTEAKIWCLTFSTSTTAPTITWPAAITGWSGGSAPTINASKSYEVSVMDGIGVIIEA